MKYILAIFGVVFTLSCLGQTERILNETLDKSEYKFLNDNLDSEKYTYDFTDKKVGFFSSPGGTVLRSKSDFFRTEIDKIIEPPFFSIVIFTENQKSKHGYDVAVIYESKNLQPKISNKLKRIVRTNN